VRGDSIRDLYAKTLAIAGLAALAGIGALVDYWPVAGDPPVVQAAPLRRPDLAAVLPAVHIDIPRIVEPPARPQPVTALAGLEAAPSAPLLGGEALWLAEPVPAPAIALVVADASPFVEVPGVFVDPSEVGVDPVPVYQIAAASGDDGFFADALDVMKLTGSTIKRGGVRTGESIVNAFRVVSGAFKKLKFF
jgi:hypothetical protein